MAIPKTEKLIAEESSKVEIKAPSVLSGEVKEKSDVVRIRKVECCNDFVAILQSQIETSIAISNNDDTFKNEGIVVGVGPGISDGNGGRLPVCVDIGDVVMFGARNIAAIVESTSDPYEGKKVIIVSERNILCKLHRKVEIEYA